MRPRRAQASLGFPTEANGGGRDVLTPEDHSSKGCYSKGSSLQWKGKTASYRLIRASSRHTDEPLTQIFGKGPLKPNRLLPSFFSHFSFSKHCQLFQKASTYRHDFFFLMLFYIIKLFFFWTSQVSSNCWAVESNSSNFSLRMLWVKCKLGVEMNAT